MSAEASLFHYGPYPPAFAGSQLFYLFALFGLMLVSLLALEWAWRICWAFYEDRCPLKHPATGARVVVLLLLITGLMRGTPDAVLYMQWPEMTPAARAALAHINVALDGWAFVPFSLAWLLDRLAGGVILYQLKRQPIPTDLWPTWSRLVRPAKIGIGVAAIAFAITYLQ